MRATHGKYPGRVALICFVRKNMLLNNSEFAQKEYWQEFHSYKPNNLRHSAYRAVLPLIYFMFLNTASISFKGGRNPELQS